MKPKSEIISKINDAISKHERWMSYAEAMYNGVSIDIEFTPLNHTECAFGIWTQENAQLLFYLDIPMSLLDEHKRLHEVYLEIYGIISNKSKKSIFNIKKVSSKDKMILDKNIQSLKEISTTLVTILKDAIEKINSKTCNDLGKFYQIKCDD